MLGSTDGILALVALLGVGFAFAHPAEFALVPAIAGEDAQLNRVDGWVETARLQRPGNGAELVALALGGIFVAAIGARATLALAGGIPLLTACVGLGLYRGRKTDRVEAVAPPTE